MKKETRALSGASQHAYFRRVLKDHPGLSAEERAQLLARLREEVAQVRLRVLPEQQPAVAPTAEVQRVAPAVVQPVDVAKLPPAPVEIVTPPAPPFDPFTPNIVVVLRRSGRAAVLAELEAIASVDDLRLLAREQRLSVDAELTSAHDLRVAIVAAAERRVANRVAAMS
jgi:hypothetical protein